MNQQENNITMIKNWNDPYNKWITLKYFLTHDTFSAKQGYRINNFFNNNSNEFQGVDSVT